jgi:hypothetical protein
MLANLLLGTIVVACTAAIHMLGLILLTVAIKGGVERFRLSQGILGKATAMLATVLGLLGLHGLEIWLWAGAFVVVGALPDLPTALYFSSTTFSTVGYGDVVLPPEWRLFASFEGVSGLLLIGWSTAYIIAASTRLGPFRAGEHF